MDFLHHMTEYYKGERLGAICYTISGVVFLLLAFTIWKVAAPGTITRGMLIPVAIVGLLGAGAGPFLLRSNNERLDRLPKEYSADPKAFVEKETTRMTGVDKAWLPLKITWTLLLVIGVCMAFLGGTPTSKGIGLGLLLIGTAGHVVDGIASERSRIYIEHLIAHT
jgi:hypothetical protein